MANLRTIQFLRNGSPYESLAAAKSALTTKASELLDGSPIVGRYTSGDTELSVLGIVHVSGGTKGITFFESANDVEARIKQLESELNAAEAAVGLNENGSKVEKTGKYTSGASTVEAEIDALNNAIVAVEGAVDGLDYGPIGGTDASVLTQIQQADGKISGLTANVGSLKLTDYAQGTASGDVAPTDSINEAVAKLQNQINAANDKVDNLDANSVSGESTVIIDVTQNNGQITASAANLTGVKLGGLSATADTKIESTDTLGSALAKLQGQIDSMDKAASAVDGQVVTTVAEADGKVTETKANVKDLQLGGYAKDANATGAISGTDTINTALSKLENTVGANKIFNADGSITVTTASTGTDIKVHIKEGEGVIKLDGEGGGIYTDLDLVKVTTGIPETVKERYQLLDSNNLQIGSNIDIPKDSHIVSIEYSGSTQKLYYTYIDVSGETRTTEVDMSELVLETEFGSGVTVTDHVAHGVVDPISEKDSQGTPVDFLTVDAGGFKVSGIKDEIDRKINALDVPTINPGAGKYIYAIEENDGLVAASGANVSDAVLNGYNKGEAPESLDVSSSDDVKGAIAKLEHQVDNAEAAAKTVVAEGTDAGNNMTIVETADATDGHKIFTINLSDVASDSALTAEIAARKAVDGQDGQTYVANANTNYIGGATSLNDADVKLDAALKAEETRAKGIEDEISGKTVTAVEMTGGTAAIAAHTDGTKKITINTDGSKILATGYDATGVAADQAIAVTDSINDALAKLYATSKAHHAVSSSTVSVSEAANGTTFTVNVDTNTAHSAADDTYASDNQNMIQIKDGGLYVSSSIDCGTF